MKKCIVMFAFLVSNFIFAQEINEATLRNDLNIIIKDATTGFQKSKAGFVSKDWDGKNYNSYTSIFNLDGSSIVYSPKKYMKYSDDLPEAFYFFQRCDDTTPKGAFINQNIEMIFNELAISMKLKVVNEKQQGQYKKTIKSVLYLDKNKRKVFQIYKSSESKTTSVYIYSDLRPSNLPKYLGCLVLYNIQGEKVVSISTNYVYGESLESSENLYAVMKSKISNQYTHYDKYEWLSNQDERKVETHLASFGILVTHNSRDITPEGYDLPDN
jgi:hypothetical protein